MAKLHTDKPILVTGATGYIASWIIKLLIDDGYTVRGSVRSKSNQSKIAHLEKIGNEGKGTLELFEADLLKPGSFDSAMESCEFVMHTASPFQITGIKDPQAQLVDPALEGTKNVLDAATASKSVKRVVLTSSVVAIYGDAGDRDLTKTGVFTEEYWNTTSSLKHQPYNYSKTLAEKEAWKIAEGQDGWDLTVINPGFVLGPSLSTRVDSTSTDFMRSMLNGKYSTGAPDLEFGLVDVRDVAQAHLQAAFIKSASKRHILVAESRKAIQIAELLRNKYGSTYKVPKSVTPGFLLYIFGPLMGFSWKYLRRNVGYPLKFDNAYSIEDLKISYRPVEDTLLEQADQLIRDGLI